jgi:hypothetical protein
MNRDIELDLRESHTWTVIADTITSAGGFPLVALPLDGERGKPIVAQGRICHDRYDLARALGWAYGLSPDQRVRLIPVEPTQTEG